MEMKQSTTTNDSGNTMKLQIRRISFTICVAAIGFLSSPEFNAAVAQDTQVEREPEEVASNSLSKSHQETWQGKWLGVYSEMKGEELDRPSDFTYITDNQFKAVNANGKMLEKGTVKLDSTQHPHHYDVVIESLVEGESSKSYSGIYRFYGNDRILVCVNITPAGPRPTTFDTANDPTYKLALMERVKPPVVSPNDDSGLKA